MRGATYTLGFVVRGAFSPFFSDVYQGLAEALHDTRYRAVVALCSISDDDDTPTIQGLLDHQVDGVGVDRGGRSEDAGRRGGAARQVRAVRLRRGR
jgi:DNA-binding LacI/PurR family transcriptional regulator